jgi:hypothetical protein
MANYSISIPGNSSVVMNQGDQLTITFHAGDQFCISGGSAGDFSPALPVGVQQRNGNSWTGTAVVPNATIQYTHVPNGTQCGSAHHGPTAGIPGTIKIGSGK